MLRVAPVDPIDPFRGAYVELAYPDLPEQAGQDDGTLTESSGRRSTRRVARHTSPDPVR